MSDVQDGGGEINSFADAEAAAMADDTPMDMHDEISDSEEMDEKLDEEDASETTDESEDEEALEEEGTEDRNYSRGEYKKVQNEARNLRARLQPYEQAFQAWTPEDQGVWVQALQVAAEDPQAGAAYLREIAAALDGEEGGSEDVDTQPGEDGLLTPEQVEAIVERRMTERLSARDYEVGVQHATEQIYSRSAELGYEEGSKGFQAVLALLSSGAAEDVDAAHEMLSEVSQGRVNEFVKSKQEKARKLPRSASGSATTAATPDFKSFDDADRALRSM